MKDSSFKSYVEGLKSVIVLLPKEVYFDQVAAGLALYLALAEKSGREVAVVSPAPMLVEFNRLVGVDKVTSELGNKNLVMRLDGYEVDHVERITSDVEEGELCLKVIPKPNAQPPKREQVAFSYTGVSAELVIMVGGANEKHFPALESRDLLDVKLAHVGVSDLELSTKREVVSFARPASSVSEVVGSLVQELLDELNEDIATNLMMGMYEGSKSFSDPAVTHETFRMAGELMKAGGRHIPKKAEPPTMFPKGGVQMMPMQGAAMEKPTLEKPDVEQAGTPRSWMQTPKIYKGTLS